MRYGNRTWSLRGIAALLLLAAAGIAGAQDYPNKPIRVLVGFPAGTTTDTVARLLSKVMQQQLGQPIVVEPRVGANGLVAGMAVKNAPPDGYTIYFGGVVGFTSVFERNNPIDAAKEFEPVSDTMSAPYLMAVSNKFNVNTIDELVAYAKTKPPGTLVHAVSIANQALVMHAVAAAKGFTYTDVNVRAMSQVLPLMVTGEVAMAFNLSANLAPGIQSKTFRPIFVTAPKRLARFPDLPTSGEVGLPGLERVGILAGFWAPKGTPSAITRRLSSAAQAAVKDAEVIQQYNRLEYEPLVSTPEEQLKIYTETLDFWTRVAKAANYQPPQ